MFNHQFLNELRSTELRLVADQLSSRGVRLLEIGAGAGQQAKLLSELGYEVTAVDVGSSSYRNAQVFLVQEYDGRTLPFPTESFDLVFSSNLLEHVKDQPQIFAEIRRVLGPDGYAVHIVPTHSWRFWTTISAFPAGPQMSLAILKDRTHTVPKRIALAVLYLGSPFGQRRHGERGNLLTETWHFRPSRWSSLFERNGFTVESDTPVGLFYTGNLVFGNRWSMQRRQHLARVLGSACHVFRTYPT
jgi:SAM-dependent methyltransferase